TLDVQNGFLKSVRVAQNQAGVVRVVLEVEKVKDYSVFLLKDPYRLVVDVYGDSTTAKAFPPPAGQPPAQGEKTTAPSAGSAKGADAPAAKKPSSGSEQASAAGPKPSDSQTAKKASAKSSPAVDTQVASGKQAGAAKTKSKSTPAETPKTEVAENQ